MNLLTIDASEVPKFPLVTAERVELAAELNATGTVSPDVSREVPVITLANGRVVDVKVRLGDNVKKDQLLFRVQSPDITNAFDAPRPLRASRSRRYSTPLYHSRHRWLHVSHRLVSDRGRSHRF